MSTNVTAATTEYTPLRNDSSEAESAVDLTEEEKTINRINSYNSQVDRVNIGNTNHWLTSNGFRPLSKLGEILVQSQTLKIRVTNDTFEATQHIPKAIKPGSKTRFSSRTGKIISIWATLTDTVHTDIPKVRCLALRDLDPKRSILGNIRYKRPQYFQPAATTRREQCHMKLRHYGLSRAPA